MHFNNITLHPQTQDFTNEQTNRINLVWCYQVISVGVWYSFPAITKVSQIWDKYDICHLHPNVYSCLYLCKLCSDNIYFSNTKTIFKICKNLHLLLSADWNEHFCSALRKLAHFSQIITYMKTLVNKLSSAVVVRRSDELKCLLCSPGALANFR